MSLWVSLYIGVDTGGESPVHAELFSINITHNLRYMAKEAGLYNCMWQPNATYARGLIGPLSLGLQKLKDSPKTFKAFNPKNGWGTYEILVLSVTAYLKACKTHPKAKIEVSR